MATLLDWWHATPSHHPRRHLEKVRYVKPSINSTFCNSNIFQGVYKFFINVFTLFFGTLKLNRYETIWIA